MAIGYRFDPSTVQDRVGNTPVSFTVQAKTSWLDFSDPTLRKVLNWMQVMTEDATNAEAGIISDFGATGVSSPAGEGGGSGASFFPITYSSLLGDELIFVAQFATGSGPLVISDTHNTWTPVLVSGNFGAWRSVASVGGNSQISLSGQAAPTAFNALVFHVRPSDIGGISSTFFDAHQGTGTVANSGNSVVTVPDINIADSSVSWSIALFGYVGITSSVLLAFVGNSASNLHDPGTNGSAIWTAQNGTGASAQLLQAWLYTTP